MWIILALVAIAAAIALTIALKTGGWRKSSNGNATTIHLGLRLTVFQRGTGWVFCIADPDDKSRPYFSDAYPTEEIAKNEAILLASGFGPSQKTLRQQREEQMFQDAPAILERAQKHLTEIEKAVAHLKRGKSPTREQIARVVERARSARDKTISLHHSLIDCGAPDEIKSKAATIPLRLIDLRAEVEAMLDDI